MGALRPLPEGAAERLAPLLKEARSKAEYQRVHCVWLRATLGLSSQQVAEALGWQASSVRHVQARYFEKGEEALRDQPQAGRYHAHLTAEEEQKLLAPFLEKAHTGEIVGAAPHTAGLRGATRPSRPSLRHLSRVASPGLAQSPAPAPAPEDRSRGAGGI
jgi:transposase